MKFSQSYVLVLDHQRDDVQQLRSILKRLRCPVVIVRSVEQAIATALETPPYLIILAGSHQTWPEHLVNDLRRIHQQCSITIVALTDCNAPSWLPQEENPGFDGFLVKPLNGDVMVSLVQSAWARQACCSTMLG
ncbi:response regulator [Leptolyngbya sp. CCY15150]|jgi:CheY-like chemotaxis protein|uniref:response regulator n=1 Tax=Leptolyngbya sp. CCY15150 TaxID=2767772 RepID=UPI00194F5C3A|nr:response regulator [Leptolyngbya sp. CCY15150]